MCQDQTTTKNNSLCFWGQRYWISEWKEGSIYNMECYIIKHYYDDMVKEVINYGFFSESFDLVMDFEISTVFISTILLREKFWHHNYLEISKILKYFAIK